MVGWRKSCFKLSKIYLAHKKVLMQALLPHIAVLYIIYIQYLLQTNVITSVNKLNKL